ncbi:DNA polymerase III subunit alpha [Salinifilum ghardaiensis]
MSSNFVHLHVHTEFSMLDGAAKHSKLFSEVARLEQPAVAMTDHGNMFGAWSFHDHAKKAGIKPIIGIEAYVAPASRHHKKPVFWGSRGKGKSDSGDKEVGGDVSGGGAYTHMTLLAQNSTGLRNLFKLSSIASFEGFFRKPRCLLPGQEIITRDGVKPIEDVRVGDEVLTHRGRFRRVTETMQNHYSGTIYGVQLSGRYTRTTWMTDEHPVLTRFRNGNRDWVKARDLVAGRPGTGTREASDCWNSWVCLPRAQSDAPQVTVVNPADYVTWTHEGGDKFHKEIERTGMGPTRHYGELAEAVDLDYDFGFLLGLYASEGSIDRGNSVLWHFHEDETDLADFCSKMTQKLVGKEATTRHRPDRHGYRGITTTVSAQLLAEFVEALCGKGAANKHLPEFTFEAPVEFMRGAYDGVLAGDGSKSAENIVRLSLVSENLIWQMRTLGSCLRGDFPGVYQQPKHSERHSQAYWCSFTKHGYAGNRQIASDAEYVYRPVREVLQEPYDGPVYNIEVEDDHSYVSDFALHNCDRELIAEHSEGVIATSGCLAGEVLTRLRLGQKQEALQAASDYKDIFGPDRFFIEVMDHGIQMERDIRPELLDVARQLDLGVVATNDSHYVTADQADHHDALLCLQTRSTLADTNRFRFEGGGYNIKSAQEMREYWDSEVPGACDNTLAIAEMVEEYDEAFAEVNRMPQAKIQAGKTEEEVLREEIEQFIPTRFPEGLSQQYRDQLNWELEVITEKGYCSYFLVVGDMVRWAKSQGIRVGPGRGSAAGALLSYLLRIIDIDPIAHGLLFERFLNPERNSPPDIDIDFDERRREEVIAYAKEKYGEESFAKVITYGTIKTKAAFKDAARVHLGQPGFALADQFSKALPPPSEAEDIPLSGIVDPEHERYAEAAEARAMIENDPTTAQIFETARGLEGLVRNAGVHACAHIISRQPLLDVLPLWKRDDGEIITGWDGPQCEAVGLLKIDILGLNFMTIIDDAAKAVQANHGVAIEPLELALDDPATYETLARGESLGLFQIEGGGMRELLKRMQPTAFADIVACNALYRPGPMEVNAHLDYADRKNGKKPVTPIHPELSDALSDILDETYGLIVYQEQIMAIAQRVAGYSLGRADLLRRAMGKKKKEVLDQEYEHFHAGMRENGYSEEAISTLWQTVLPFAGYAFNKSHAAAYGIVTYWSAYFKTHYPAEYMAALLTAFSNNKDKTAVYLSECRRMNVKVLPPDVNESAVWFSAVDGNIRFGLGAIRNVGTGVAETIIQVRAEKGACTGFADFLTKVPATVCSKKVVESLVKAGAFDSSGVTRMALNAVHEEAVEAMSSLKKHEAAGQFDLFGGGDAEPDETTSPLAHLAFTEEEWPRKQRLSYEREMLGLYVSAHPLDGAEGILRSHAHRSIAQLKADAPGEGEVTIAGLITGIERRVNKNGQPWAIVTIEDHDDTIETLFFAKAYSTLGEELVTDTAVAVKGRVNWRDDTMSVFASGLVGLDISEAEHNPTDAAGEQPFLLRADPQRVTEDAVAELKSTLAAHAGQTPVYVQVGKITMYLPHHSVDLTRELFGELKGIPGIGVQQQPALAAA